MGTNVSEEQVEAYIANLASSPDPAKLIEAAAQISESDVPLEKLEEHVKTLQLIDLGSMSKENNGKGCSLLKKSSTGTIGIKEFSAGDPISRERLGTVLVGLLSNELMRKRNISDISYARDACTMIVKSYLAKIKTIRMPNWPLKILRLFLIRSLEYHLESRSVSHF